MQTKYKIIISVFAIVAILYFIQFIVSFVATEKKKDANRERFEEKFESGDVYMDVLRATENYFAANRNISIDVKAQALEDLSSDNKIKEMSGLSFPELEVKVKQHVDKLVKKEKFGENNAEDENEEEKEAFEEKIDVSLVVSKLDKLITEMTSVKDSLAIIKEKQTQADLQPTSSQKTTTSKKNSSDEEQDIEPKQTSKSDKKTSSSQVTENFTNFEDVSGFENMRTFASFNY